MRTAGRRSGGSPATAGLGEAGSVSAELAVALPAAVLVVLLGIAGLGAASQQVRLQDAAADAARLVARGEDERRAFAVVAEAGGALAVAHRGDLVCATATAEVRIGAVALPLSATGCALAGGL
jgi:Flp pilus assembly protein TadG